MTLIVTEYVPSEKLDQFHAILCATGGRYLRNPLRLFGSVECITSPVTMRRSAKPGSAAKRQSKRLGVINGGAWLCADAGCPPGNFPRCRRHWEGHAMSANRELLELAAKAGGINQTCWIDAGDEWYQAEGVAYNDPNDCQQLWNPIDDDRDALQLAVKKSVFIEHHELFLKFFNEELAMDNRPSGATRRAIVRVVVETWKAAS